MSSTDDQIQLKIACSQDPGKSVDVAIPKRDLSTQRILRIGTQDLGMKVSKSVYLEKGEELQNPQLLKDGDEIYVSNGNTLENAHAVIHVCMLGSGAVGKSALTLQFIQNQFIPDYDPTIEDAYRKPISVDGSPLLLDILDTAGQEDFIALRTSWMRDKDGLVLVFSIVHRESFEGLKSFYDQICDVYEDGILPPIILVGNKADLDNPEVLADNPKLYRRQVSRKEAQAKAREWGCIKYVETSAMLGQNVAEMYGSLVRSILSTRIEDEPVVVKKKWYEKCTIL